MTPFDYVNSIMVSKEDMRVSDPSMEEYKPWVINVALSHHRDLIFFANGMNLSHHLPKSSQYDYYLSAVRPKKRFAKWLKKTKYDDLEIMMQYFGYSRKQALEAISILSEENITTIRNEMEKGGTTNERPV